MNVSAAQHMTRAEANRLLDLVRHGNVNASAATITLALRRTGDIGGTWPRTAAPSAFGPVPGLEAYLEGADLLEAA
jgi:hypothetical protein